MFPFFPKVLPNLDCTILYKWQFFWDKNDKVYTKYSAFFSVHLKLHFLWIFCKQDVQICWFLSCLCVFFGKINQFIIFEIETTLWRLYMMNKHRHVTFLYTYSKDLQQYVCMWYSCTDNKGTYQIFTGYSLLCRIITIGSMCPTEGIMNF